MAGKPEEDGRDIGCVSEAMGEVQAKLAHEVRGIMANCEAQLGEAYKGALQDMCNGLADLQARGLVQAQPEHQRLMNGADAKAHQPTDRFGSVSTRPRATSGSDSAQSSLSPMRTNSTLDQWKKDLQTKETLHGWSRFTSGQWIRHKGVGEHTCAGKVAISQWFNAILNTFIIGNCFFLGMQAHALVAWGPWLANYKREILAVEFFFTAVFFIEVLINIHVFGLGHFWPSTSDGRFNFVDLIIAIVPGVLLTWVVPLATFLIGGDSDEEGTRILTLLRVARVARIARVFYRVPFMRDAWVLIRGLGDSASTLVWTCIVIAMTTYVFAIGGVFLITQPLQQEEATLLATEPEQAEPLAELISLFNGIDKFMFTLTQFLTVDSANALIRRVQHYLWYSWIFFFAYMTIATLALMNLVTAIIVDTAVKTNSEDREMLLQAKKEEKAKALSQMKDMWSRLDRDRTGTISLEELQQGFQDPEIAELLLSLDFQSDECEDLFNCLNHTGTEIDPDEFFAGLLKLLPAAAQAKDIYKLEMRMQGLAKNVAVLQKSMGGKFQTSWC